ncbi:hypothetical protein DHEL01_v213116 [Diaporthe helianthi]|uniref:Uncharacterized protein n=1 Tax=Diaporthe helianthi TaxID=158607 RepID=A0A2P5HE30_DIAHE|nr:hypothetical protein DHEL01_v213116 [Diaporthe helianthi]
MGDEEIISQEDLTSVAAYLVRKGASLEAGSSRMKGPSLTPLQYALEVLKRGGRMKVHAPVALIMLGAKWDMPLVSDSTQTASFLSHCVRIAMRLKPYLTEKPMDYARVIKAIVSITRGCTSNPAPTQGSEHPMHALLDAFSIVANKTNPESPGRRNRFAIEAVGRLLLSTGIRPAGDDMENWKKLIARNRKGKNADKWATSPWRHLIANLPTAAAQATT